MSENKQETMRCPACNMNWGFGTYCVSCGTKLEPIKTCECGRELWDYFQYCPDCGKEIKKEVKK
jgi:predicted amidophosphoribosyltransferase